MRAKQTWCVTVLWGFVLAGGGAVSWGQDAKLAQEPNTWVKRSPLPGGPRSPALGYEGSFGYDPGAKKLIRWAGHNQGGGGEQNAETWTYDPASAIWALNEPNISPPGVCCAQQNVFDPVHGRFLRFKGFSGNHGWQWFREIYLNNSAAWSYDLAKNTWRDLRCAPAPYLTPLRCASWDREHQVAVIFGGEGSQEGTLVFDPHDNTWTRMNPKTQPQFRSGGNMAYDAVHKRHIMLGSQFSDDPHTWAYDLAKNEWFDLKPTTQPPSDRNDPVLAFDEANGVIVASVRAIEQSEGKEVVKGRFETWVYESGPNVWKKMSPAIEPPGGGNRRRIMAAIPDQNVVLMENYVNPAQRIPGVDREQQIWTYRYADPKPSPQPTTPVWRHVRFDPEGALLEWNPTTAATLVERRVGKKSWLAKSEVLPEVPAGVHTLRDKTLALKPGEIVWYTLRAKDKAGLTSAPGQAYRCQPAVVEELLVQVESPTKIVVRWATPADSKLTYHVERAVVEVFSEDEIERLRKDTPPLDEPSVGAIKAIGPFARLTKQPLRSTSFTDDALDLLKPKGIDDKPIVAHRFRADQLYAKGKPYRYGVYAYRVVAQDETSGIESGPGPYALTIPSSPQWVFSKEDGVKCHLKWAANSEAKLQGYRVYRMDSPRINGPGQKTLRLQETPLSKPGFVDEAAGDVTRRYWIVAVDALGQEGFPSAPTWFQREHKRFYDPFVGGWHQ